MKIILVRHGEAASSWEKSADPGLSDLGKAQAEECSNQLLKLKNINSFSLISSPLIRAKETSEPLSKKINASVSINPLFAEKGWDKVMNINLKGLFYMTQKCLPLLRPAGTRENPARVINIGSIDGIGTPVYESYVYSSSKAAVHHLTRVLGARLVKENILVNAIAPGAFPSNMLGSAVGYDYSYIEKTNPVKRIGTAEDIGGLALYLSSRAGCYTVGETITCDGGAVCASGHALITE